jgi:hypothetical protein
MRRFRYYSDPQKIKDFLKQSGFELQERYSRDGSEALGFAVQGTYIELSYDLVVEGQTVGHGMIVLHDSLLISDPQNPDNRLVVSDAQQYAESLRLYRRLQHRFGKPASRDP